MTGGFVLNQRLRDALVDCAGYPHAEQGTFVFRPRAMEALEEMGLVRRIPAHRNYSPKERRKPAYTVTDKGREALESLS